MRNQHAEVEWRSGQVPVSTQFDDPYFSLENGLEETRHVFLDGNGLPGRLRDGFHIAELGFGTGLNFLTTLKSWRDSGVQGQLFFTSFEAFPMSAEDMSKALNMFPELENNARKLLQAWADGCRDVCFEGTAHLQVVMGDARNTLPRWSEQADAWYLDGFSPAKNPDLWQADLMAEVGAHTRSGGTAATYTAAGFVRRGLAEAGFDVTRRPGYGRKRHMTVAVKRAE